MKALIISYHFLPLDVIATYRAKALADNLKAHGVEPTILTHRWEQAQNGSWKWHEEQEKSLTETYEAYQVIRVPRHKNRVGRIRDLMRHSSLGSKCFTFASWLIGDFDVDIVDSYYSFKKFLFAHLKTHQYDVVVGIFSPHNHLKLCYEVHEKFGVPYVLDFRDLWDNRVVDTRYRPAGQQKLQDWFVSKYWKKWLKKAAFFTITSTLWRDYLHRLTGMQHGEVVTNGFEESVFSKLEAQDTGRFTVAHTGSLYHNQKLEVFLEGARLFVQKCKPADFCLELIGAKRGGAKNKFNGYLLDPEGLVKQYLTEEHYIITPRKSRQEAIQHLKNAQLLLFPAFPTERGRYTGKIFEYLGARKNILIVPSDGHVVDELIRETSAGEIADTPEQVADILERAYREWQTTGENTYRGEEEKIRNYSREAQVAKMAAMLGKHLKWECQPTEEAGGVSVTP